MFLIKIILFFFVFIVWISNGVSELDEQQKDRREGKRLTLLRKTLAWSLGIALPILLASGIVIQYWPF